jgi:hypothetical protein
LVRALLCLFLSVAVDVSFAQSNYSFEGTFLSDDQIELFDFTLLTGSTVTLQSLGYGGGVNSANTTLAPGGFDSYFAWFAANGTQIGTNDDGTCSQVKKYNGACLDAFANIFLPAGSYILALTESGNDSNGNLSDGFSEQGAGDFTANGSCKVFCDGFGNTDDGSWAVDILNVTSASPAVATPEPATMALCGCAISLLLVFRRRRGKSDFISISGGQS